MNNSFYNDFAVRFAATTLTSLVESFNSQVGKRGFNSARAAYDQALIGLSGNLVGISINLCKSIQKELFINDTP